MRSEDLLDLDENIIAGLGGAEGRLKATSFSDHSFNFCCFSGLLLELVERATDQELISQHVKSGRPTANPCLDSGELRVCPASLSLQTKSGRCSGRKLVRAALPSTVELDRRGLAKIEAGMDRTCLLRRKRFPPRRRPLSGSVCRMQDHQS